MQAAEVALCSTLLARLLHFGHFLNGGKASILLPASVSLRGSNTVGEKNKSLTERQARTNIFRYLAPIITNCHSSLFRFLFQHLLKLSQRLYIQTQTPSLYSCFCVAQLEALISDH